jgi:hypothetical protein
MSDKKNLMTISIILWIIAVISFISWMKGLLDIEIVLTISWIASSVALITFLFITDKIPISQSNVIIPKGYYEEKAFKADTNIFPNFLVPTNTNRNCIFRINLQIKEFTKHPLLFYIVRKREADIRTQELNKDIKIDPGQVHTFDIAIGNREKLNFKFNEDVTIQKLMVEEIYIA